MAAPRPSRPFTRRGITFTSQYAYRQYLAAERGFPTPAARNKAIAAQRRIVDAHATLLTPAERGVLAAGVADWQGRIGSFIEGQPTAQRLSSRLPPELLALLKKADNGAYPVWRLIYR